MYDHPHKQHNHNLAACTLNRQLDEGVGERVDVAAYLNITDALL
jgi:hypothetical protein